MAEIFPVELQDKLNEAGFSETIGGTAIETEMGVGLPKKRQRFTKGIDTFTCNINLEKDDYSILSNFFKTTLAGGVKTFLYDHPITGVESEFQFIGEPAISPMGGLWFRVNMNWRLIP